MRCGECSAVEGGRSGKSGDGPRCEVGFGYATWSVTVISHRRVIFFVKKGDSRLIFIISENPFHNQMVSISGNSVFSVVCFGGCETVATVMPCSWKLYSDLVLPVIIVHYRISWVFSCVCAATRWASHKAPEGYGWLHGGRRWICSEYVGLFILAGAVVRSAGLGQQDKLVHTMCKAI